jgi:hypothetical protein
VELPPTSFDDGLFRLAPGIGGSGWGSSFLRMCISRWHFSEFFHLNVIEQMVHMNGFASLWIRYKQICFN